jgi:hypothetical protein
MQRLNIGIHGNRLKDIRYPRKKLQLTNHVLQRMLEKKIIVPKFIEIKSGQVVEAELNGACITKLVVRQSINTTQDLVLVLIPKDSTWLVVTAWLNDVTDTHKTLKKDRLSK